MGYENFYFPFFEMSYALAKNSLESNNLAKNNSWDSQIWKYRKAPKQICPRVQCKDK